MTSILGKLWHARRGPTGQGRPAILEHANRQHGRYYNFDRAAMFEHRDAMPMAKFLHALSDAGAR
jgi:hypothetical protein